MWVRISILVFILTYTTNAYKILIVSPVPSKSHSILGAGLVRHLSRAGHEITYITAFPPQKPDPRVKVIDVSHNQEIVDQEHKNCYSAAIIFITHGGLLSISKVIHFGVPIIGIPVFIDQFGNVERAGKKGFAKRVDLSYTVADDLREAIHKVLTDKRFRETVKDLSFAYHDIPVPPGKELIHWVEHVIKTKGAPHLRSPALIMPWYQKHYFDLIALLVLIVWAFLFLIKTGKKLFGINNNSKEKIN